MEYNKTLQNWKKKELIASDLVNISNKILIDKGVELVFLRKHLTDKNSSEILNFHDYGNKIHASKLNIQNSLKIAKHIYEEELNPAKIDIGRIQLEYLNKKNKKSIESYTNEKIRDFLKNKYNFSMKPKDVILFGFGRIGRLAARELIKQAGKGQQLRLRAIVIRNVNKDNIEKRKNLLEHDSVHGYFKANIQVNYKRNELIIDGQIVKIIESSDKIDYTKHEINNSLLIDNTGAFRDKKSLNKHLKCKGVSQVILTAPGKEIPNIVYGINEDTIDIKNNKIVSAASCTTNAIAPVLKIINDKFKIKQGHLETIHAYTNDQNLLDNMHKKNRRGRSAAINMVLTSTGAGKAVSKVIPELKDKLTANAVRVPTPNGSIAIISMSIGKKVDKEILNNEIKKAASFGKLVNQIHYSINNELVSSDIIGNSCCAVFDSHATTVSKSGKEIVIYVWYDNEYGYTKQVLRLSKFISKVRRLTYY